MALFEDFFPCFIAWQRVLLLRSDMLSKNLTPIDNEINELSESVSKTLMGYQQTELWIFTKAVKQNKDKVPGLNVVAEEMAEFFKKVGKKAAPPQEEIAATKLT